MTKKSLITVCIIYGILCAALGAVITWGFVSLFTSFGHPGLGWFIGLCFVIIMLMDVLLVLAIGQFSLDDEMNDTDTFEDN